MLRVCLMLFAAACCARRATPYRRCRYAAAIRRMRLWRRAPLFAQICHAVALILICHDYCCCYVDAALQHAMPFCRDLASFTLSAQSARGAQDSLLAPMRLVFAALFRHAPSYASRHMSTQRVNGSNVNIRRALRANIFIRLPPERPNEMREEREAPGRVIRGGCRRYEALVEGASGVTTLPRFSADGYAAQDARR